MGDGSSRSYNPTNSNGLVGTNRFAVSPARKRSLLSSSFFTGADFEKLRFLNCTQNTFGVRADSKRPVQ